MFLRWWEKRARKSRPSKSPFHPLLEQLEARQVPATLMVTTTADSGAGSLRQAILDANNTSTNPGQNTIHFNIATSGVQTISLLSGLPAITNPSGVIIDGTSEPGFASTPLIVLNGSGAGTADGLVVSGGNSTIKGLTIQDFASGAAVLLASSGNTVEGNLLGTDSTGATAAANQFGVDIASAGNNTIGGTTTAARNIISGNSIYGVVINGSASTGNLVEGNFIGVDNTGNTALANSFDGVTLLGAARNTIGGTASGAANVISGNGRFGVFMEGTGTSGNVLEGNLIGTNQAGTAAVANSDDGIALFGGAASNTIGGTTGSAANVLSGNSRFGLLLSDSGTTGNLVQGNVIGLNKAGTAALANGSDGLEILSGASGNTIGGTTTGAGNTIAGNGRYGLLLGVSGTTRNVVAGNLLGTNGTGTSALANAIGGLGLVNGAASNTIGGTTAAAANVLSGNSQYGILLSDAGTTGNLVQGNNIGVNKAGTAALANPNSGVVIVNGASANTIGGTAAGAGNIISGNSLVGVLIGSSTAGNLVQGNFIGTNTSATTGLPNGYAGVMVAIGASSNTIGGTATGAANTIAFNGYAGVIIGANATDTTVGDQVSSNKIFANGGAGGIGIDLGNNGTTTNNGAGHTGPNHFQTFPVPTAAAISNANVAVSFTFSGVPSSTFRVEFYLNNSGDTPQGRTFLGNATVTTDGSGALATVSGGTVSGGVGTITLTPPTGVTPTAGQGLTAIAILTTAGSSAGTTGDTSELSALATLTTVSALAITPTNVPNSTANSAYSQTIHTTGGFGTVTFSQTGTLPPGLTLNSSTGVLSGTPTTAGSFTFTVMATDALGDTASQAYPVTISSGLAIANTSLPNGTVNQAYTQTITATGGTAPYTFTSSGTLPTGLTLSSTGVLSGTPTIAGSFNFTVTAHDAANNTASQNYTLVINPAPAITTTSLPGGTVGQPNYSQTIATTGGTAPFTFTTSAGTLPTGLTLSSTGVLSGTPTAAGSFTFTITATDSATPAHTASQSYTVSIASVSITTTTLPSGAVNAAYSQTISTAGGTAPITFATTSGTLPTGLILNSSTGVLSGTPSAAGNFTFTIQATDSASPAHTATQSYTVSISGLAITTTSLPNSDLNTFYNQTITASGGTGTLAFTETGTLPPGLTLSSSGVLSGTPTTTGSFTFTVTASDTMSDSGSHTYTVTINPAVSITTTTLPSGATGVPYSQTLSATGGTGTLTFSAPAASLPPGLTLSTAGVLSGTPTTMGAFNFTVTATDKVGASGSQSYTLTITG